MSSFDSSHFSQVKGADTGTRRVPGYTYLFVGCVLCSKYTLTPLHNSFYATLMTALVLPHAPIISFVKFTTNLHPALKLTWTISGNSPPFLNLPITGVYLSTDIEPTDTPRCLDYTSSHSPLASMPVWEKVQTRSILCRLPLQMLPDPLSSSSTWCFTQDSNICSFLSHQHH